MSVTLYGIPNCDTVKKARKWLEQRGTNYSFTDYKKAGANPERLKEWAGQVGWEALLNKRGTTFRKLDEANKTNIDEGKAILLMATHPSLIKRPVLELDDGSILVGFEKPMWDEFL